MFGPQTPKKKPAYGDLEILWVSGDFGVLPKSPPKKNHVGGKKNFFPLEPG